MVFDTDVLQIVQFQIFHRLNKILKYFLMCFIPGKVLKCYYLKKYNINNYS